MKQRVKDKIAKLLALAESANPYEAALAMQKAKELLYRHELTEEDIHKYIEISDVINVPLYSCKKRPSWKMILGISVCTYFDCVHITMKSRQSQKQNRIVLSALGLSDNAHCAQICFEYLLGVIPAEAKTDFRLGFAQGIRFQVQKLKEQEPPTEKNFGLIVTNKVQAYMDANNYRDENLKPMQAKNEQERAAGFEKGMGTQLNRQVPDTKTKYLN